MKRMYLKIVKSYLNIVIKLYANPRNIVNRVVRRRVSNSRSTIMLIIIVILGFRIFVTYDNFADKQAIAIKKQVKFHKPRSKNMRKEENNTSSDKNFRFKQKLFKSNFSYNFFNSI